MADRFRYLRWLPAIMMMSAIALISHQSDPVATLAPLMKMARLGKMVRHVPDYIAHFSEYFLLALAIGYALRLGKEEPTKVTALTALLIVALFALSDELHQAFIPRRTPDIRDFAMDMLGAISALTVLNFKQLISHLLIYRINDTRDPIQ